MATQSTLSQAVLREAHALALKGHTWPRGRSRADGRQFYVIPSRTEPQVAHWTSSYGCTCRGARRNGDCAHSEAVRLYEAREAVTSAKASYDELFRGNGDRLTDAF